MTKQTKKLTTIFAVMAITMFTVIKANAEVTKVQDLNGCDMYFSTQLWSCVEVPDSKDDKTFLLEMVKMMSNTDTIDYKKNFAGLPRLEETKVLKAEDLKEDVLKLLDIAGEFYLIDSYWAGKGEGSGGKTEAIVWKEGEKIYCHSVVINRNWGIGLYKNQ